MRLTSSQDRLNLSPHGMFINGSSTHPSSTILLIKIAGSLLFTFSIIVSFNILSLFKPPVMAPIRVVGDEFCVPYYTDLVVKKKLKSIFSSTHFQVFDPNGTLMFKVDDGGGFSQHSNRYMRDAGGFPIILMRNKIISWHDRWRVYRGESHAENNHLFTVKRSRFFQLKTQLDVFLATNTDENRCDFHVKSNFSDHSSKVYRGDSVIAEIDKKSTWGGFFVGKDVFNVRVFPEVDYAFIVSLLIILQEITSSSNHSAHHHHASAAHHHHASAASGI